MRRHFGETGWDPAIVRVVCAVPIVTATAAVIQHGSTPRAIGFGVGAALPWVLLAVGVLLPWWVSAAVEIGCTAGFVADPATYDVAPLLLVMLVAVYAATESRSVSVVTLGAATAMMVGLELTGRFLGSAIWILAMALGWVGGFAIRLQDRAHVVREKRATQEERARIARELHDVVAHSLAVTMLHLTGARLALRRDPTEAEAALRQAEESGRQSMADIRRVVGLLGEVGTSSPMPGASDVPELVREFRDAGLVVTLSASGDLETVPPVVGLTMYRIVQESIANVVKHAPGAAAEVEVAIVDRSARVSVRNPAGGRMNAGVGDGHGVAGMAERTSLVGGTFRAGPTGSDWCVTAELPIGIA